MNPDSDPAHIGFFYAAKAGSLENYFQPSAEADGNRSNQNESVSPSFRLSTEADGNRLGHKKPDMQNE